jgi:hypothetical protein
MKIEPMTEQKLIGFTLSITPQEMDTLTMALRNSSRMIQSRVNEERSMGARIVAMNATDFPDPNNDEFNLRATNTFLISIDKVRSGLNESKGL